MATRKGAVSLCTRVRDPPEASDRSPEAPTLELRLEATSPPIHDKASRKPVRIRRGSGGTRQRGARSVEVGRANGVNRTVVEVVLASKGIGELGYRSSEKLLEICSGCRDRVDLFLFLTTREPDMIDCVCTDRYVFCGSELQEFCWRHGASVGRMC